MLPNCFFLTHLSIMDSNPGRLQDNIQALHGLPPNQNCFFYQRHKPLQGPFFFLTVIPKDVVRALPFRRV